MQDGPEKTRLWRELQDKGAFGSLRMFVGRNTEGEPTIALNDSRGRQRLRLSVDTDDTPRVELLDEQGGVIYTLPPAASQPQDQIADLHRQIRELQPDIQHLADRARASA